MRDSDAVFEAGERGDFRPALAALDALSTREDEEASTLRDALLALVWLAEPSRGALPSVLPPRTYRSASSRACASRAFELGARAALLAFDSTRHASFVDAMRAVDGPPLEPRVALIVELCCLRQAVFFESDPDVRQKLTDFGTRASELGLSAQVVDATALRALAELSDGELATATMSARRAARMARTESLPQSEYLANLVLARVRRLSGRAHLAVRILAALARVVPEPWLEWITWELVIAGDLDVARALSSSELSAVTPSAGRGLFRLFDALTKGDVDGFTGALDETNARVADMPPFSRELRSLAVALDPRVAVEHEGTATAAWANGATIVPPDGFSGLTTRARDAQEVLAWVVSSPGRPARRVLGPGIALGPAPIAEPHAERIETAAAVLLLANAPSSRQEFFERVYGFSFEAALHSGPLEVLVHRLRQYLSEYAEVVRGEEMVEIRVRRPFAVPDPRCSRHLEDRLLRSLAERGARSARDVASAVGVPLRSVQKVLRQLVEDGACEVEKKGRVFEYRVEDTSFSEPTRHDLKRDF